MIIIGHEKIEFEKIYVVHSLEDIGYSMPNSCVVFNYNLEMMEYCKKNDIAYGVYTKHIKEAVLANAMETKYIITLNSTSKEIQDIANEYMFDAKILEIVPSDDAISSVAKKGVDGIIYESLLKGM
jgi:hypothetical protein